MSSGGKGGSSASQSKNYYGTLAGAICWGPLDWLTAIVLNGNYLFQGNLTLTQDVTDLTGSLLDPSVIASGGYLKLYCGTETQPADGALAGHPPYRGTALLVAKNIFFGQDSGSAPNLQIIGGRLPRISTAIVAAEDNIVDDGQVNLVAALAELLTDERGAGVDISQLDAASWLASGHWCAQDQDHRDYTFCSPCVTEQAAVRDLVKQLFDPIGGFLRWTSDGKIACKIYEWGVDPGGLPLLDARQWTKPPKLPGGDWTNVPTEVLVNFVDRAYEYQDNSVQVPNARAAQIRQVDDQARLDRKHITRADQAHRHGTEYNRRIGLAPSTGTISVRQPFVEGLAVGDKIKVDTDPEPGGAGLAQLARIEKIEQDPTDEATLTVLMDVLAPATAYTPTWIPAAPVEEVSPPLEYMLAVPLAPALWDWPLAVALLATRPAAKISGFEAFFGTSDEAPFANMGSQRGFAVRASLQAAIDAVATSLAFTELDGLDAPDAALAANTPGGNTTEAADNALLALITQLDGNGRIALGIDGNPIMEFVSIVDRAMGEGLPDATFNYTVLRGRLGTAAQAWGAGAAVWIVPWINLTPWRQELISGLAGGTALFRLVSFTPRAIDDSTPIPECSLNVPPATAPMMAVTGNRTFRQPDAPTGDLRIGDLWFDTDDGNKEYRWDGSQWVAVGDSRIGTQASQISQININLGALLSEANSTAAGLLQEVIDRGTAISGEVSSRESADGSLSTLLSGLTTDFNNNVSAVAEQLSALSSATDGLASDVEALSSTVGGISSEVDLVYAAFVIDGQAVATAGFKLDANGKIVSMQAVAASGGSQQEYSAFIFSGAPVQSGDFVDGTSGWQLGDDGILRAKDAILYDGEIRSGIISYDSMVGASGPGSSAVLEWEANSGYHWRIDINDDDSAGRWWNPYATLKAEIGTGDYPVSQLRVWGPVVADSFQQSSRLIKDNIAPIGSVLDRVLSLVACSFTYNAAAGRSLMGTNSIGFIAEDVGLLFPEVVWNDPDGVPTINYGKIVVILAKALQELAART